MPLDKWNGDVMMAVVRFSCLPQISADEVLFNIAKPNNPRSPLPSTSSVRIGFCLNTPSDIRRTAPVFFSNTRMLCLSMTAMLVGKDNPVVTNSILRLFL